MSDEDRYGNELIGGFLFLVRYIPPLFKKRMYGKEKKKDKILDSMGAVRE